MLRSMLSATELQMEIVKVTEATLTYVVADANRKPCQVPPLGN